MGNACCGEAAASREPAAQSTDDASTGEAPEEPEPRLAADSVVHLVMIVKSMHCDLRGFATVGTVLQWMDICACLSAERHAGLSAVTVAMDSVSFEAPLRVGSLVRLNGCVTNAFNTSMEVKVHVEVQDPFDGHVVHLTTCYFIFVAMGANGDKLKQKLPQLVPQTEQEFDEVVLSKERRKLRFEKSDIVETMLMDVDHKGSEMPAGGDAALAEAVSDADFLAKMRDVPASDCIIEVTQLVLPSNANHHGNTFGGQIMSWMDEAASVVAVNYLTAMSEAYGERLFITTVGIDSVAFLGASRTGDRISLKAGINRVFRKSMEVGVRVEAAALGGEPRHINTAFFTLVLQTGGGEEARPPSGPAETDASKPQAVLLAPVVPDSEAAARRYRNALGRRRFRLYKRSIASRGSPTSITWTWNAAVAKELCLANTWSLLSILHDKRLDWTDVAGAGGGHRDHVQTASNERTWGMEVTSLRARYIVRASPKRVAEVVKDLSVRSQWDTIMQHGEVRESLPDIESDILWAVFRTPTKDGDAVVRDFSLLRTYREDHGRITLAYRSVRHAAVPPTSQYDRGDVLPSGFVLKPLVHESRVEEASRGKKEAEVEAFDGKKSEEGVAKRWSLVQLPRLSDRSFRPAKMLANSGRGSVPEAATWTELTYVLQMHAETAALAGAVLAGQSMILHKSMLGLKKLCEMGEPDEPGAPSFEKPEATAVVDEAGEAQGQRPDALEAEDTRA